MECTEPDISIDFIYELIKTRYYNHINVRSHPELVEIAENPEIGLSKLELEELKPKVNCFAIVFSTERFTFGYGLGLDVVSLV